MVATQLRSDQNGKQIGDFDSGNQLKFAFFVENRDDQPTISFCIEATHPNESVPDSVCKGNSVRLLIEPFNLKP